jgi:Mg-chelatase subunit ChlI
MRKNMNADKLIKIAKLLDEKNQFVLADKLDKIAQTSTSGLWYQENPNAAWYDPANWAQKFDAFSGRQTMYDLGRDVRTQRKLNRLRNQNRDPYNVRNQNRQNQPQQYPQQQQNQSQQYPLQQNQPQQPQQQNALLVSTTPQQFVQNLFQFGKQNNLGTLSQTMNTYAQQGGTLNGQPINQNQQTLKLYDQVKNYSGILTPQQILAMLTGVGQ